MLLTDVPGVLDKSKKLIPELSVKDARKLIADGTISGGMIPKVETCIYSLEQGVEGVVIIDGKTQHAVLLELFTNQGTGTLIHKDATSGHATESHRHSCPKDGFVPAHPGHPRLAPAKEDVDARHRRQVYAVCARQTAMAGHDGLNITRSFLSTLISALPAAAISFLVSSAPAYADLKLCNRMSYVVEAAIGIDDKAATATRGWFRIDPAACRVVAQGTLTADRILLNARALGVYGSSPIPQNGGDTLCIAPDNFVIAAARQCRSGNAGALYPDQPDPGR